jgi:hypothetical protein
LNSVRRRNSPNRGAIRPDPLFQTLSLATQSLKPDLKAQAIVCGERFAATDAASRGSGMARELVAGPCWDGTLEGVDDHQ